uniref:ELMO domain-containing protein 2-like n=1 Tax=Styela clava TaxID=7725 RepID=UPI00193A009E|nr:ELMO domain-containing protein 2-like [Styela clava]
MMNRESCPKAINNKRDVVKTKLQSSIFLVLYRVTFLRSFVKWLLRKLTGACELQRIIRTYKFAERNEKIEQSLLLSKHEVLRDLINLDVELEDVPMLVTKVMNLKNIVPEMDPPFEGALTTCLLQMKGYKILFDRVEVLRKELYDCENESHEKLLLKLWELLKPDEELDSRICKRWCELGFQGSDPKTDFRGMGLLGLQCMVHFAENHNEKARQILQHSLHPVQGYSFAIVSINLTSLMYEMLQSGQLRTHFYNKIQGPPTVEDFLHAFSCVFSQFDKFWFESEPENVMAFSRIRGNFALQLGIHLSRPYYGSLEMQD